MTRSYDFWRTSLERLEHGRLRNKSEKFTIFENCSKKLYKPFDKNFTNPLDKNLTMCYNVSISKTGMFWDFLFALSQSLKNALCALFAVFRITCPSTLSNRLIAQIIGTVDGLCRRCQGLQLKTLSEIVAFCGLARLLRQIRKTFANLP